jgi:hypothetical protein
MAWPTQPVLPGTSGQPRRILGPAITGPHQGHCQKGPSTGGLGRGCPQQKLAVLIGANQLGHSHGKVMPGLGRDPTHVPPGLLGRSAAGSLKWARLSSHWPGPQPGTEGHAPLPPWIVTSSVATLLWGQEPDAASGPTHRLFKKGCIRPSLAWLLKAELCRPLQPLAGCAGRSSGRRASLLWGCHSA